MTFPINPLLLNNSACRILRALRPSLSAFLYTLTRNNHNDCTDNFYNSLHRPTFVTNVFFNTNIKFSASAFFANHLFPSYQGWLNSYNLYQQSSHTSSSPEPLRQCLQFMGSGRRPLHILCNTLPSVDDCNMDIYYPRTLVLSQQFP